MVFTLTFTFTVTKQLQQQAGEAWSLVLQEQGLVCDGCLDLTDVAWQEDKKNFIMKFFVCCTVHL
jgi:hypothetical protein